MNDDEVVLPNFDGLINSIRYMGVEVKFNIMITYRANDILGLKSLPFGKIGVLLNGDVVAVFDPEVEERNVRERRMLH